MWDRLRRLKTNINKQYILSNSISRLSCTGWRNAKAWTTHVTLLVRSVVLNMKTQDINRYCCILSLTNSLFLSGPVSKQTRKVACQLLSNLWACQSVFGPVQPKLKQCVAKKGSVWFWPHICRLFDPSNFLKKVLQQNINKWIQT